MSDFLTNKVLEESHTAKEYLLWAKGLVEQLKSKPNGLEMIRLRVGLAKELMDEVIPIGLLASKYFGESDDVRINLKIGSQSYDAVVSDHRKQPSAVSYIEVTLAHEGEDEYLRMWHLHKKGNASGLGRVTKHGTKKTGLCVEVAMEPLSQAEVLQRERGLLLKAIDKKLEKKYPQNTLLLVAFDDVMAFDRKDNIKNLEDVIVERMSSLRAFHTIAVVGLHQGLYICKRTGVAH